MPANLLYLTLLALTVVTAAGSYWRWAPRAKAAETARIWREESDAHQAKAERLEGEVSDLHKQIDALNARISAQDSAIDVLRELVTGKGKVDELTALVEHNHAELLRLLK